MKIKQRYFSQSALDAPTGPYFTSVLICEVDNSEFTVMINQMDENFLFSVYQFSGALDKSLIDGLLEQGDSHPYTAQGYFDETVFGLMNVLEIGVEDTFLSHFPSDTFDKLTPNTPEWQSAHSQVVDCILHFWFDI